jgi:hypothetical protein
MLCFSIAHLAYTVHGDGRFGASDFPALCIAQRTIVVDLSHQHHDRLCKILLAEAYSNCSIPRQACETMQ